MAVVKPSRKGGGQVPGGTLSRVRTTAGNASARAMMQAADAIERGANEAADNIDRWQASKVNGEKQDYDLAYADWQRRDEVERVQDADLANRKKNTQKSHAAWQRAYMSKLKTSEAREYAKLHQKAFYKKYEHAVAMDAISLDMAAQKKKSLDQSDVYVENTAKLVVAAHGDPEVDANIISDARKIHEANLRETGEIGNLSDKQVEAVLKRSDILLEEAIRQGRIEALKDAIDPDVAGTLENALATVNNDPYVDEGSKRTITEIARSRFAATKYAEKKAAADAKEAAFQSMWTQLNGEKYGAAADIVQGAVKAGQFTPEEEGRHNATIERLAKVRGNGHPADSDPQALRTWYKNEAAHRNGEMTNDQLFDKMLELGPKIDGVRFEKGIEEVYKPADPDDLMENPIIKTYVDILDTMYGELELDAGVTEALERAKKKNEAYEAIKQWAHKNPDANADETAKAMQKLIGEPAAKAWYENLWRVLMKDVKFPSNIVPPGKQTYGRFGPAGRKMKTKEGPDTQAEFEEEVRRLNETDRAEALKYYNKWMHKWL